MASGTDGRQRQRQHTHISRRSSGDISHTVIPVTTTQRQGGRSTRLTCGRTAGAVCACYFTEIHPYGAPHAKILATITEIHPYGAPHAKILATITEIHPYGAPHAKIEGSKSYVAVGGRLAATFRQGTSYGRDGTGRDGTDR